MDDIYNRTSFKQHSINYNKHSSYLSNESIALLTNSLLQAISKTAIGSSLSKLAFTRCMGLEDDDDDINVPLVSSISSCSSLLLLCKG